MAQDQHRDEIDLEGNATGSVLGSGSNRARDQVGGGLQHTTVNVDRDDSDTRYAIDEARRSGRIEASVEQLKTSVDGLTTEVVGLAEVVYELKSQINADRARQDAILEHEQEFKATTRKQLKDHHDKLHGNDDGRQQGLIEVVRKQGGKLDALVYAEIILAIIVAFTIVWLLALTIGAV